MSETGRGRRCTPNRTMLRATRTPLAKIPVARARSPRAAREWPTGGSRVRSLERCRSIRPAPTGSPGQKTSKPMPRPRQPPEPAITRKHGPQGVGLWLKLPAILWHRSEHPSWLSFCDAFLRQCCNWPVAPRGKGPVLLGYQELVFEVHGELAVPATEFGYAVSQAVPPKPGLCPLFGPISSTLDGDQVFRKETS